MFRPLIISLSLVTCTSSFASPVSRLQFSSERLSPQPTNTIQLSSNPIAVPVTPSKAQISAEKPTATPAKPSPIAAKPSPQKLLSPREQLISLGHSLIGTPYQWGGTTPKGFDCSGFVSYLYSKQGVTLPRTSNDQFNQLKSVDEPAPGDLVFFYGKSGRITHVGMYIGNGNMVHSPQSGESVRIESIEKPNWKRRYAGARRILPHHDNKAVIVADTTSATKSTGVQLTATPSEGKLFQFK